MEGTIYYTSVLLDCKCLTATFRLWGLLIFIKKKLTFNTSLLQKDLQYKNCKAQQCGCPLPPQEKVVQKRDLTKVEMVMTKKTLTF